MAILAFAIIPLLLVTAFLTPRRLFKYYVRVMAAIGVVLLFWAFNLEKTADGSHIYGLFLVASFIAISALVIGTRYLVLWKTKPKATP